MKISCKLKLSLLVNIDFSQKKSVKVLEKVCEKFVNFVPDFEYEPWVCIFEIRWANQTLGPLDKDKIKMSNFLIYLASAIILSRAVKGLNPLMHVWNMKGLLLFQCFGRLPEIFSQFCLRQAKVQGRLRSKIEQQRHTETWQKFPCLSVLFHKTTPHFHNSDIPW